MTDHSATTAENDATRLRDACNGADDFTNLRLVREAGWKDAEILEYARICYHRAGKDTATDGVIRKALANMYGDDFAIRWRREFRKRGSIIAPPRTGPIVEHRVSPRGLTPFHRYWPYHSSHVVAKVNDMARARYRLPPNAPVPVNQWNELHYEYFDDTRRRKWAVQKEQRKAARAKAKAEKEALLTPAQKERARLKAEKLKRADAMKDALELEAQRASMSSNLFNTSEALFGRFAAQPIILESATQ